MVDPRPDDDQVVLTRDIRALADLGVTHTSDDRAAAMIERRLAETAASPVSGGRRWWSAHRPLALALVATVVTGSAATAATLSLVGSPSEPLQGPLPAAERSSAEVRSSHYRVSLFPTLTIGESGWCLTEETTNDDGLPSSGGSTCGQAADASQPLIAGMSGSVDVDRPKAQIIESIVDSRIAGLRLHDGSIVTARADPSLPDGWRSLIVIQDVPRKSRYLGPDGRASPSAYAKRRFEAREPQAFRVTDPSAPARTCSVRTSAPARTTIVSARELTATPKPIPGLNGRPFLSCATARITHGGADLTAAVLVDAANPASRPARLPGASPRDGAEVSIAGDISRPDTTARRVGNAWLLVQGADAARRKATLDDLTSGVAAGREAASGA